MIDELDEDTVEDSMKLSLVPGVARCSGGEGAFMIDWLTALEESAEEGQTPGDLLAAHPAVGPGASPSPSRAFTFTRPICPYPRLARYKGGDDADAASFECLAP